MTAEPHMPAYKEETKNTSYLEGKRKTFNFFGNAPYGAGTDLLLGRSYFRGEACLCLETPDIGVLSVSFPTVCWYSTPPHSPPGYYKWL